MIVTTETQSVARVAADWCERVAELYHIADPINELGRQRVQRLCRVQSDVPCIHEDRVDESHEYAWKKEPQKTAKGSRGKVSRDVCFFPLSCVIERSACQNIPRDDEKDVNHDASLTDDADKGLGPEEFVVLEEVVIGNHYSCITSYSIEICCGV